MKLLAALVSKRRRCTRFIVLLSGWMMTFVVIGFNQRQQHPAKVEPHENTIFNDILHVCTSVGVRFILIEPDVLKALNVQQFSLSLVRRNHLTVAVEDDQVEELMSSLSRLKNQSTTAWSMSVSPLDCSKGINQFIRQSLPCILYSSKAGHILLQMNGAHVHVIVLFSRGSFYWSAPLSLPLSRSLKGTSFKRGSYAYERFAIEKMSTTAGPVYLPADVGAFLFQHGQSEFMECNPAIVANVEKQHPQFLPRNTSTRDQLWLKDLRSLKHAFESRGKHVWLFDGTLLGWWRECGIIAHTKDVDMATDVQEFNDEFKNYLLTRKEFYKMCTFKVKEEKYAGFEINFYGDGIKTDVFCLSGEKDVMWKGYFSATTVYRATYPLIARLCSGELLGHRFTVPCNFEAIILKEYGPFWQKPALGPAWRNMQKTNYTYDYKCHKH